MIPDLLLWSHQARAAGVLPALLAAVTLAAVPAGRVHADDVYDFESLRVNYMINGQDGWVDQPGQGQAAIRLDPGPVNGSKIVQHVPSVAFNESAYITRVNDAAFAFPPLTGTERRAVIQFDCNGEHIAMFALGRDVNGDGMLRAAEGEIGPAFGTYDRQFRIDRANQTAPAAVAFGPGNAGDDWYRFQLRIDFAAFSGEGAGSLWYRNLTDGDPEFLPVPGLQDIQLDLGAMSPAAGPARWDAMWLHLRTGGSNIPFADNLVPRVIVALTGDVNGDGVVDVRDLLLVLAAWGPCPGCPEDVNGDDVVDVQDLLLVLANWTA